MAGEKLTKYCELCVTLVTGARLTGKLHVESRTTSTVRPSDAIREIKDGFLLLTDVTGVATDAPDDPKSLMIPIRAIAHIELPSTRWTTPPPPPLVSVGAAGS